MPYKRDLDGQAFGVLYGLQDAASGAVSTLSHSPFFGTFLLNGRPVMLLNAHLGVAPGADPGAVLRQVGTWRCLLPCCFQLAWTMCVRNTCHVAGLRT